MPPEQRASQLANEPQKDVEIRARWAWVEPAAWTDRMLTALETGLKGSKWYRLIDNWVAEQREAQVGRLERELRERSYRPLAVKRVWIEKPGSPEKRPLGVPAVRDRVVQGALRHVIEPIFERDFAPQSYGFRPGRGCKQALRRVDELLKGGHGIGCRFEILLRYDPARSAPEVNWREDRRRSGARTH